MKKTHSNVFGHSDEDMRDPLGEHAGTYTYSNSSLDKEAFSIPTGTGEVSVTRRHVLYGALGMGALIGGGAGVRAITNAVSPEGQLSVLSVKSKQVTKSTECDETDYSECVYKVKEYEVPYGSLIYHNDPDIAAVLIPTDTASPLAQVGILFIKTGTMTTVLTNAVGVADGFEIYDVRANSSGVIWIEANSLKKLWRVYTATLTGTILGEITMAEDGDSDWEMPSIAVCQNWAYYQLLPRTDGSKTDENSLLKKVTFSGREPTVVYSSPGRFQTPPSPCSSGITVTPRTDTDNVHYQLTLLSPSTNEVLDKLVLPQSMKPLEAGYGRNGFYFSFDSIYDYGDGISNLGTYTPLARVENAQYSTAEWFAFVRTPTAPPAWCGKYFVVKSTTSVLGFDLSNAKYWVLDVPSGSSDYGTYLATVGEEDTIVCYTNVSTQPLNGDLVQTCTVEVWGHN